MLLVGDFSKLYHKSEARSFIHKFFLSDIGIQNSLALFDLKKPLKLFF